MFDSLHLHHAGLLKEAPPSVRESRREHYPRPALRLQRRRAAGLCKPRGHGSTPWEGSTQVWPSGQRAFQALPSGRDSRHLLHAAHTDSDVRRVPLFGSGSITPVPLYEPMTKWSSRAATSCGSARYRLGSLRACATVALRTSKPLTPGCNSRHALLSRGPAGCRRSSPKADVSGPTPDRETIGHEVPDVLATLRTLRRSGSTPTVASAGRVDIAPDHGS